MTYSEGCKTRSDAGMVELSSLPNLEIPARKLQEPVERRSRSAVVEWCSDDGVEPQMHHKRMKRFGTDGHVDRWRRTDGSKDEAGPSAEGSRRRGVECWVVHSVRAQKPVTGGVTTLVEVGRVDFSQFEVASREGT